MSSAGDDAADGLTVATAWRTLDHAIDASPAAAEIHVAAGVYREDSEGLGYLRLDAPMEQLCFIADGEVRLRARVSGACVLDLAAASGPTFLGFTVDGADSCTQLVKGTPWSARFQGCRFMGVLSSGVALTGGAGLAIVDCDFGAADTPLAATAVQLTNCSGAQITNCDFFTVAAGVVRAERCASLSLVGNNCGSPAAPLDLGSNWAVFVTSSNDVDVRENSIFLRSGHGIGCPAGTVSISSAAIVGNTLTSTSLANQYGIMVGSETPVAIAYEGVEVAGNSIALPVPTADTAKHDLFVGYTLHPRVHDNQVGGGGYGLVIKGNLEADVRDNEITGTWRNGILDKAGWDCEFHGNNIEAVRGRCVRLCNDDAAGREIRGSRWYGNAYSGSAMAYELSAPVTPAANDLLSDGNAIRVGEHGDPLLVVLGGYQDLWTAQTAWGWDVESELVADEEPPLPRAENLQIGGTHALLLVECTELCTGWLAFGTGELTDTLRVDCAGMALSFAMSQLLAGTTYQYRFALIDSEAECFVSEPASFTTEASSAAPPSAGEVDLSLGDIYPNPTRTGSRFILATADRRDVELALFSVQGRRLLTWHEYVGSRGSREVALDGRDSGGEALPAGVYLIRATDGESVTTQRWVLLR